MYNYSTLLSYLDTAEKMCESVIDGIFRSKNSVITFTFRLDHTCYDKNGDDIGQKIFWKVKYTSTKGSRYVKVDWTPFSYVTNIENWEELADHDSCWRGCWDAIKDYAQEELLNKFKFKGNESWFFTCERVDQE